MLFGHLAVSVLLHRYLGTDLKLTVAGGIAPDIVDKTLCQVLRLTPDGRMLGHSLLGMASSVELGPWLYEPPGGRSGRARSVAVPAGKLRLFSSFATDVADRMPSFVEPDEDWGRAGLGVLGGLCSAPGFLNLARTPNTG
jgi:hypothetical protein